MEFSETPWTFLIEAGSLKGQEWQRHLYIQIRGCLKFQIHHYLRSNPNLQKPERERAAERSSEETEQQLTNTNYYWTEKSTDGGGNFSSWHCCYYCLSRNDEWRYYADQCVRWQVCFSFNIYRPTDGSDGRWWELSPPGSKFWHDWAHLT